MSNPLSSEIKDILQGLSLQDLVYVLNEFDKQNSKKLIKSIEKVICDKNEYPEESKNSTSSPKEKIYGSYLTNGEIIYFSGEKYICFTKKKEGNKICVSILKKTKIDCYTPSISVSGINQIPKYNFYSQKSYSQRSSASFRNIGNSVSLINLGNTCFMNAIIQAIYHFNEVWRLFQNSDNPVIISLYSLLIAIERNIYQQSLLNNLHDIIGRVSAAYSVPTQKDAKDFYTFIMNLYYQSCSENAKMVFGNITIIKITKTYNMQCYCKRGVLNTESFFLPLRLYGNLQDTMNKYISEEKIIRTIRCEICKIPSNGLSKIEFNWPEVLVIYFHQSVEIEIGSYITIEEDRYNRHRYQVEVCITRLGMTRDYGHFYSTIYESNTNIITYDDSFILQGQKVNNSYMILLKKYNY